MCKGPGWPFSDILRETSKSAHGQSRVSDGKGAEDAVREVEGLIKQWTVVRTLDSLRQEPRVVLHRGGS